MPIKNIYFLRNVALVYCLLLGSCTFNVEDDRAFTLTRIGTVSDTVTIWQTLQFYFSVPVAMQSSVELSLNPDPGLVYVSYLSKTRDTMRIDITQALKGNTVYTITLKDTVQSQNEKYLYPAEVSFSIVTSFEEMEPNNSLTTCDTLLKQLCGISETANDTDFFFCQTPVVKGVYLKSIRSKSGLFILDTMGVLIAKNTTFDGTKVIAFGDSIKTPCIFGVFPLIDNAVRYELGVVR